MDWEFYKGQVRQMANAGVKELGMFYLGESFLYKKLPEAIKFAKDAGIPYVFLTTNGSQATPDKVEAAIRAGLDSLKFSFNWPGPEECLKVSGKDAYSAVYHNIKFAREVRDRVETETNHRCGLYASSIQFDGEQQEKMETAVEGIRPWLDQHYWLPLYNQASLVEKKEGEQPIPGNRGRIGALRPPMPCWGLFTEGHITWDGKLSACFFDHDNKFEMADLNKVSFLEGWNSQEFQNLRAAHLAENVKGTACEQCLMCED
jgi:hypothetical protein